MIIMRLICLLIRTLGVLVFIFVTVYGQSPCRDTFEYHDDGYEMYGVINIQPNGPVSYVNIKANFTIAAQLPSNYFGSLEPLNQNDLERRLVRGDPIRYKVNFPITSPLPLLTSIVANGKLLCYGQGNIPGPNQIITTINLEHVLNVNRPGYNSFPTDFVVPSSLSGSEPSYMTVIERGPMVFKPSIKSPDLVGAVDYPLPPPATLRPPPRLKTPSKKVPTMSTWERDGGTEYDLPPPATLIPPELKLPSKKFTVNQPDAGNSLEAIDPATVECGAPTLGVNALILLGDGYLRGDWPWVVAIFKKNIQNLMFVCSGSLVSERHVITAAHCIAVRDIVIKTEDIVVRVGAFDLDDISDDIAKNIYIEKATSYDTYDPDTLKNDLLILTLQKKVVYNDYIRPVCLWSEDSTDLSLIVNKRGVVTGWGANEYNEPGRGKPRKASIPIVSSETCKASREDFHKLTSDMTLCAGDRNGTGPCNGDSGGGLYMKEQGDKRWKLRGIVSVSLHSDDGEYVCNVQEYIVFTDVAKYLPWIKSIMSMP